MGARVFRFPRVVLGGKVGGLMGVQGRSEGSWLVRVLPPAGAGPEVLVAVGGRGRSVEERVVDLVFCVWWGSRVKQW